MYFIKSHKTLTYNLLTIRSLSTIFLPKKSKTIESTLYIPKEIIIIVAEEEVKARKDIIKKKLFRKKRIKYKNYVHGIIICCFESSEKDDFFFALNANAPLLITQSPLKVQSRPLLPFLKLHNTYLLPIYAQEIL